MRFTLIIILPFEKCGTCAYSLSFDVGTPTKIFEIIRKWKPYTFHFSPNIEQTILSTLKSTMVYFHSTSVDIEITKISFDYPYSQFYLSPCIFLFPFATLHYNKKSHDLFKLRNRYWAPKTVVLIPKLDLHKTTLKKYIEHLPTPSNVPLEISSFEETEIYFITNYFLL